MPELNQKDYSTHIQILEKAKDYLWDGTSPIDSEIDRTEYICHAISGAAKHFPGNRATEANLISWIRSSLGIFVYVTSWLSSQLGKDIFEIASPQEIQAYRLAWINQMISLLKEED